MRVSSYVAHRLRSGDWSRIGAPAGRHALRRATSKRRRSQRGPRSPADGPSARWCGPSALFDCRPDRHPAGKVRVLTPPEAPRWLYRRRAAGIRSDSPPSPGSGRAGSHAAGLPELLRHPAPPCSASPQPPSSSRSRSVATSRSHLDRRRTDGSWSARRAETRNQGGCFFGAGVDAVTDSRVVFQGRRSNPGRAS